jgi:hypothetical protein
MRASQLTRIKTKQNIFLSGSKLELQVAVGRARDRDHRHRPRRTSARHLPDFHRNESGGGNPRHALHLTGINCFN